MKTIQAGELAEILQGTLIGAERDQLIKHAVSHPRHTLKRYSLIFYDPKKDFKLPSDLSTCIIAASHRSALPFLERGAGLIKVDDVMKAYWRFVSFYRSEFDIPVIGVTGTSGKTTTKEMIACMLGDRKVVRTALSHNALERNLHYLVQFDEDTEAAVMEMGVSGPNQLLYSARHFRPSIGIITKITSDHMQDFKTQEAYFHEKIQMLRAVGDKGTIILNTDDEYSKKIPLEDFKGTVIYFGQDRKADFRATDISFNHEKMGMDFILHHKRRRHICFVPGFGTHNVYNALAAFAAVSELGLSIREANDRLESLKHVRSHLELLKGRNDCMVIDDTWNTNRTSIEAALEVLAEVTKDKRSVAVLGNIAELGAHSVKEHRKIGEAVAAHHIDHLITIGKHADLIGKRAAEEGMDPSHIHHARTKKELSALLLRFADPDTVILLKTSMRSSYRQVVEKLIER